MNKLLTNQPKKSWTKAFRNIWFFSIVVFTIAGVYIIYRDGFRNATDQDLLMRGTFFLILIVVGSVSFALWIFSAIKKRARLLTLLLLLVLYSIGVVIANIKAKPFIEALRIVQEAEGPVKKQMQEALDKDGNKQVEIEREYNALYTKVATIDLAGYPMLQGYIKENLQLSNEMLAHDEAILSGQSKLTQEESDRKIDEFSSRRKDILNRYGSYARIHTWMKIFLVGIIPSDFASKIISE